jgi:hypothetical protein
MPDHIWNKPRSKEVRKDRDELFERNVLPFTSAALTIWRDGLYAMSRTRRTSSRKRSSGHYAHSTPSYPGGMHGPGSWPSFEIPAVRGTDKTGLTRRASNTILILNPL